MKRTHYKYSEKMVSGEIYNHPPCCFNSKNPTMSKNKDEVTCKKCLKWIENRIYIKQ